MSLVFILFLLHGNALSSIDVRWRAESLDHTQVFRGEISQKRAMPKAQDAHPEQLAAVVELAREIEQRLTRNAMAA